MKVIKKNWQSRRDCNIDIECEACGHIEKGVNAYDDDNMWKNVVPDWKCKECGKSTIDLGLQPDAIKTKYEAGEII